MRKIPPELENPIDDALLEAADATMPFAKKFTPNQITVLSISLAILSIWALVQRHPWTFALSYSSSVFLDYVDGHLARTTNQVTKIGDFMDHASDTLLALAVVAVLAYRLRFPGALIPIGIIVVFGFLQAVHLGYQQKFFAKYGENHNTHDESLNALSKLAPGDPDVAMRYSRFVGVGTYHVLLLFLVLTYGFAKR
jgi:phosphatidylglycerophosphate synthase